MRLDTAFWLFYSTSILEEPIEMLKRGIHCLLALCVLCFLSKASLAQGFEDQISAFEQADLASPPPANPILFVGSSSIRWWPDLAGDFPDYPVMNRGFGGSQMSDVLYYFDRIVAPYDPALILVYEGGNDLAAGKSVDEVYADHIEFLVLVEEQLPDADVAFIATKPSPSRSQYLEVTRQLNIRREELASTDSHLWFIDIFTPMLNENGQPRPELFGSDMLHMNAAGYELWKSIIGPVLDAWAMPKVQTLLLDFGSSDTPTQNGPAPDDPLNFWNNVTGAIGSVAGGQLSGLVNTLNVATTIGLEILSPFNGSGPNKNGTLESTVFVPNATRDSLYGNTETWGGLTDVAPSFKLTRLDPERIYNFTLYASRLGVGDVRETSYTIVGESITIVTLDPVNNINNIMTAVGIVPDALSEITVSLAPTENNNNGYHFIYLGAMKVEEVPEQQPIIFIDQPAGQTIMTYHQATFQTAIQSTPPYIIQWFRDGEMITDANEFAYTIDIVTPDMDGAVFSVSVSNLVYSEMSEEAVLHVVPDTNSPVLLSAESTNGYTIALSFNECLNPDMASAVENYSVNEETVEIVGVELDVDARTVILTLGEYVRDSFDVSVSFVQDLAGNEIVAGTTMTGPVRLEVLLFDFGTSNRPTYDDQDNTWNNVTQSIGSSDTGRLKALVDVENIPTKADLVMIRRFNGANTNGTRVSTVFPQNATRDSLFGNTELYNGLADVFPGFKLTGLDPLLSYDFIFYASRRGGRANRETGYTVTGANSGFAALNPTSNEDQFVTVTGIKPDSAGEIMIELAPTANNDNLRHFTYLGVMKVEPKQ
jgi:lysophospholipase L1-like esterase